MTFGLPSVLEILERFGYLGIYTIIFLEMAVIFCFFLPADSLLLAAGALASNGILSLPWLMVGIPIVAVVAYLFSYCVGRFCKSWVWSLPDRFLYKRAYLEKAQAFYDKYGSLAVSLGRFVPIVRTFVPVVAGLVEMPIKRFTWMSVLGGIVWGAGLIAMGYGLGIIAPGVLDHMGWFLMGVVVLSITPAIMALVKHAKACFSRQESK